METDEADEVAIAGLWIALAVREQEEVFTVDVEPVFRQRFSAGASGIGLQLDFSCSRFLPGEREEDQGESPSGLRHSLCLGNRIYASDGFHRCKTTSCITQVKGQVFAQKRATPKGCPVAMSPFMAGTVKEMEIKVCQLLFGCGLQDRRVHL